MNTTPIITNFQNCCNPKKQEKKCSCIKQSIQSTSIEGTEYQFTECTTETNLDEQSIPVVGLLVLIYQQNQCFVAFAPDIDGFFSHPTFSSRTKLSQIRKLNDEGNCLKIQVVLENKEYLLRRFWFISKDITRRWLLKIEKYLKQNKERKFLQERFSKMELVILRMQDRLEQNQKEIAELRKDRKKHEASIRKESQLFGKIELLSYQQMHLQNNLQRTMERTDKIEKKHEQQMEKMKKLIDIFEYSERDKEELRSDYPQILNGKQHKMEEENEIDYIKIEKQQSLLDLSKVENIPSDSSYFSDLDETNLN